MLRRVSLALFFLSLGNLVWAEEPAAQLILPARILEPGSTFEVRFAADMISPDQIGKPAALSPLVFAPPLEGKFIWLSTRSGTFMPASVLPLATKYQITLASGLQDARGKGVSAKLRETAETPPMRVKGTSLIGNRDLENATVVPRFLVLFNANIEAAAAAKFIRFEDAAHNRIPARVEQAGDPAKRERIFPTYESDDRNLSAWSAKSQPEESPPDSEEDENESDTSAEKLGPARGNILFVAPTKPLPPGKDWRLVLDAGIPASEWKAALPAAKQIQLGNVVPFAIKGVTAQGNRLAGRRIAIEFSKSLAKDVSPDTVGNWIKIEPAPPNLKYTLDDSRVILSGDFALGQRYQVSVAPGVPAREPTRMSAAFKQEVVFEKFPSRLYFQDVAAHQYTGGTRQLRLLSVNVPRLRVTAKIFEGENVAAAVKAFDKYEENPEGSPDEIYTRVGVETLAGEVVWEKVFTPGGSVDSEQILPLDWNEIVGSNRNGAILFTAESLDPVGPKGKRVGVQILIQLTDFGAVWKREQEATRLHIFSLATGKGVPRARLQLLNGNLEEIAQSVTDARGDARFDRDEEARWVFVQRERDAHLIALSSAESILSLYHFDVTQESGDEESDGRYAKTIFLFTERGVYKPGDKLYLKGYAQDPRNNQPRVPAGKQLTVTITDSKEREIFSKKLTLSEFGSFDQEISLPQGALGKYQIVATGEKGAQLGGSCYFQVQEYKPNAFEISIPAPPLTTGDTQLALSIGAKYFMGKPLSKAKLTWSLVARDEPFAPEGLLDFAFCNGITDFRLNRALDRFSQFNAQGEAIVNADGVVQVAAALPVNPKAPQPRAAKFLCEVTDINQQTVSESRAFVEHASDFYFGLRRLDSVVKEGEPLSIELIALKPDGKPLEQPTRAVVRLAKINWQTNRLAAAGDTSEFESKANLQMVWEKELATVAGLGGDRKPNRALLEGIVAGTPGEYLLEASGQDSQGHPVLTSLVFEVSGDAVTDWNYRNPYAIDLVADKETYEPGEIATLLVKTPIAGDALVSVERDRVFRSFIVPLTGNAPSVQVPLIETDGPNVFVSVMLLRGANDSPRKIKTPEYRLGYINLKIARPKEKLSVKVKPAAPSSRPGETIQLEAEVRDWRGKGLVDAEVTLYAVDEGVLSLTSYETPDPLAFFNQPRGLSVTTSLTLPTLLKEDLAESDFANKGYLVGDGKGGPALLDGLRKNFVACPFWNATLRTDALGQVHAEFPAPDSLTRYRIIAVAATKEAQFGVAQSAFEINKPVMIESAMPAFANLGDKLVMRAVAHNTTSNSGKAEVYFIADATARAGETQRLIDLPANGSVAIDLPLEIVGTGTAKWKWAIKFGDNSDAVEAQIHLGNPAPLLRQVETKRIESNTAELLRVSDPQIMEGSGEVAISLTNSRVLELRESLRQLLHYPYGCVEQTTSSMLPWLTVRDLRATLPELARADEEIASAVNHGVQLLLSMQTSSGGLSYWPKGREPMLWGSAYGGLGLTLAKKQGFAVPEADYKRLLKYLSEQLRGMAKDVSGYRLSDRCLTIYTLARAGAAEPAYHDLLFQKRAQLSAEDRALVALAVIESKGPKKMIDELLRGPSVDAAYVEQWFGSLARENAMHLLAWTIYQPRAPKVDQLATDLFARRSNGHWGTTQSNAWSLLALSSYLRAVETGSREANGKITWGAMTKSFAVSTAAPASNSVFPIDPATVRQPMTLAKDGGQVFSEVTVSARARLADQPRQDQGYSLTRRYAKIGDDGKLAPPENLRVGDRILVTLDVDARRRATYIALEDPLPSVLAPINPAFKSQESLAGEALGADWISDHSELREDRAVFFVDLLNAGKYTLRYLARVVCAGEAIAPAAKIEEMYHPERFGTSEAMRVSAGALQ